MCEILDSSCLFWAARSFWSPVVAVFSSIVPSCLVTLADWSSSFRGQPISLGVSLHLWQGRWKWGTVMSQPYSTLFGDNLGCSRNHGLSYRFFFFFTQTLLQGTSTGTRACALTIHINTYTSVGVTLNWAVLRSSSVKTKSVAIVATQEWDLHLFCFAYCCLKVKLGATRHVYGLAYTDMRILSISDAWVSAMSGADAVRIIPPN